MLDKIPDQKVLCVIGMHRSGTSCLIGSLQNGGLALGEHSTWDLHNTRGNRENPAVVNFHEGLLEDHRASWDRPPRRLHFNGRHRQEAARIIGEFSGYPCWGFKDPRTTLALPLWRELIPGLQIIGIFRHPLAVAASLQKRDSPNGISTAKGLSLWYHYNDILYREYRRQAFPLLSFDWDEEYFHLRLNEVHQSFNLRPLGPGQRFYNAELQHFSGGRERLPWRVGRLYRKLQTLAG